MSSFFCQVLASQIKTRSHEQERTDADAFCVVCQMKQTNNLLQTHRDLSVDEQIK